MPTVNPRVNVTLSPALDAVVSRLAELERISKSQVLRELLEAAEPSLQKAVALLDAAMGARAASRRQLKKGLEDSQRVLEGQLEKNLAAIALHARDLVSEAQAVRGRRPTKRKVARDALVASDRLEQLSAVAALSDPPPSNRGVKTPSAPKTARKAGGLK